MNDDKITELVIKISSELATLNANMATVLAQLADHNNRITKLENHPSNAVTYKADRNDYSWIVQWLIKGLMIALGIIATTTGASSLISKILS